MTYTAGFESQEKTGQFSDLSVSGAIPEWLTGSLIRTAPGKFEVGDESYRHWFDGLALLHAFQFDRGRVDYASRYLKSESYKLAKRENRIVHSGFGTDPCRSIFKRFMQLFTEPETTDNGNVNVGRLADKYVAMTETPMPVAFDPETLETDGRVEFPNDIPGDLTTAHPQRDRSQGMTYNYLTEFGRKSTYRIVGQADGRDARDVVAEIEVDRPCYMHSFGMTEHYIVLVEFPVVLHPLKLLLMPKPTAEQLDWSPDKGTRFLVIDKETGEVTGRATAEPFFSFHHVNAYEEDGRLVVDMAVYPDSTIIDELYLDNLRSEQLTLMAGHLERFRLPPDGSQLRRRRIVDERIELPRINGNRYNGRPYRYVWGASHLDSSSFLDRIIKIDVTDNEVTTWEENGCYPGEPVFVERPDPNAEDDGVVLSVVLDAETETSFLLILDAATLEEIGRADVPHHIPFGFHGQYFE